MKRILMISTGGTIASEQSENGLAPAVGGASMIRLIPELEGMCNIEYRELLSLDSSNIQPRHWTEIADAVVEEYENYDGFVISHGTDTMAYTASALCWMLEGIRKPVAVTGAQLPIEAPMTDGKRNLFNAFRLASGSRAGVYLVFGGSVIDGSRAKKLYTQNFEAFASVNTPCAALITRGGFQWAAPEKNLPAFNPRTAADERVFVYKLVPGAGEKVLDFAVQAGYRAIVIEGFGAGGVPNRENTLLPALERALKAGVIVVCITQCIYDGTHLDVYDTGVLAQRLGALSADCMTLEAVVTKLMWALGNTETNEEAKELFLKTN